MRLVADGTPGAVCVFELERRPRNCRHGVAKRVLEFAVSLDSGAANLMSPGGLRTLECKQRDAARGVNRAGRITLMRALYTIYRASLDGGAKRYSLTDR